MDQFRQIGKVLGSLKALMVFKDDIQIHQRQCCLLVDIFTLAFEGIAQEIKENLKFQERNTKWKTLEQPLKELHRIFKEGEFYVQQCLETKDWWAKAISLAKNTDCVEFHIHNLLCCIPIVIEAIEIIGEISGTDQDDTQRKRLIVSKKYEKEWQDPKLFQWKFGKQYLVSQDICKQIDTVWKEDRWSLLQLIIEKKKSGALSKQEQRLAELLFNNLSETENFKLFPSLILVGSKDYQVRRRLGSGSQYKEIQWLGESFAARHCFGEIEPLIPDISLLSSLSHPNISNVFCGFSDEEKKECFMITELMNKDLNNYIKEVCGPRRRIPFSLPVAVDLMLQIARGMEYLHCHKIYHGDLNPSNVLVKARKTTEEGYLLAKVTGFSLSAVKNTPRSQSQQNGIQAFIWYAPEVLLEQEQPGNLCAAKYSEKADVYSFGMICFELLTGKVPFDDSHLQGDKMSRNIRAGERPLFPFPSPKYLTNLTKRCWQTEPVLRPTFSSICRVLRYIKRFLVMNPEHGQPDAPSPQVDYFEVEMGHSKKFLRWGNPEPTPISLIPFQMFSYKVLEKEKTNLNLRERSSESGSEGASVCGDENLGTVEDPFPTVNEKKTPVQPEPTIRRNSSAKKLSDAKATKQQGTQKGRTIRPPQLTSCGRSLRMNSETQLPMVSPNRRRSSGHASDSEIS
ncbi:Protein kinase domain [Macleaya cordata]|uniref:Protein kinase domain n=1 Tax=Macleaya cordata TaxID=56857 RepID=A0A200PUP3_MACCD|nr:Protein kinase domain [Macleaya cordata]